MARQLYLDGLILQVVLCDSLVDYVFYNGSGCSSRKSPAMPRSPHIRMARWPKTPGELLKDVLALRDETDERELCLWCVQQVHL